MKKRQFLSGREIATTTISTIDPWTDPNYYKVKISPEYLCCKAVKSPNVFTIKVIQRRGDYGEPRENFYRDWADYKRGFGDPDKEFWLGNEEIHQLTKSGDMKLRVELEAHGGGTAWAEYSTFQWVL